MIDFMKPVDTDEDAEVPNGRGLTKKVCSNGSLKRKQQELYPKHGGRKNFDFIPFRDPVLFIEHLSVTSLLVIDKPWMQVVDSFDTKPVHRHIFGT